MGASHLTSLVLDDVMSIVRGDAPAVVTCTTNMTKTAPAVVVRCDAPAVVVRCDAPAVVVRGQLAILQTYYQKYDTI